MFMTKKSVFVTIFIVLLIGFSVYLNRERFKSDPLTIGDRTLQPRGAPRRGQRAPPPNSVIFLLSKQLRLTSVRVVYAEDFATNKYPHAIWELNSDSNSVPVKDFIYGANIRGMKPSVPGAVAETLQPGVKYRLFVEAGSIKGEHEFTPAKQMP